MSINKREYLARSFYIDKQPLDDFIRELSIYRQEAKDNGLTGIYVCRGPWTQAGVTYEVKGFKHEEASGD